MLAVIEKYHDQGYPDAVAQAVGALITYRDSLRRQARRRIAEAMETVTDPKDLLTVPTLVLFSLAFSSVLFLSERLLFFSLVSSFFLF